MRILLLTHSFNSLTQRVWVELTSRGHEVSIEFDISDSVLQEAVDLFQPEVIVAPYLRRAIPEKIWRNHLCLIVHPGPRGDRGPSALDWAIHLEAQEWGVTVLQAEAEMDAGPVWASKNFQMRGAPKGSIYRNEVTEAAVVALFQALDHVPGANSSVQPVRREDAPPTNAERIWRPLVKQADRAIDWNWPTAKILARIRAADGFPGVLDEIDGEPFHLFDACEEDTLRGTPGEIIARRHHAICRATGDGALWIGHLKRQDRPGQKQFKLPAAMLLGERLREVPEVSAPLELPAARRTYSEIRYEERDRVGYLHFPFYNGAMSTAQCERLRDAFREVARRDTRVIVLMGGPDFWSNGIHLNVIEAAESPADESWRNINAMNDLVREIVTTDDRLIVSAMQGNAGAGGVFLALAADRVVARSGVILNPHYKAMGNLYGSEYWTYLLPRRVGAENARTITEGRLPVGAAQAKQLGLIDEHFGATAERFWEEVERFARALADTPDYERRIETKRKFRLADEAHKPLEKYREEELAQMYTNFYGFDPSYHVARYNFVFKVCHSRTPLHLARHRQLNFREDGARGRISA